MGSHVVVGITGASGTVYALRLCEELLKTGCRVTLIATAAGLCVLQEECGEEWSGDEAAVTEKVRRRFSAGEELSFHHEGSLTAAVASGSAAPDAMVVVPCSMGSLSRIACGTSGNLLERTADVMLKERRRLLLVPRETPLHEIHLENMLKVTRCGGIILPAMPAFYHAPRSVDDLVDFVVGKIMDLLQLPHELFRRWGGGEDR